MAEVAVKTKLEVGFSFFKKIAYLFIFGCADSLLLRGLSLAVESGGYCSCCVCASHCDGFSCRRAWTPGTWVQ